MCFIKKYFKEISYMCEFIFDKTHFFSKTVCDGHILFPYLKSARKVVLEMLYTILVPKSCLLVLSEIGSSSCKYAYSLDRLDLKFGSVNQI